MRNDTRMSNIKETRGKGGNIWSQAIQLNHYNIGEAQEKKTTRINW